MQPFKINRNSWHYKMNCKMTQNGDSRYYMEDNWEPKHSNFCAYWRTTVFKLVWIGIITFGIASILFMIGDAFYAHTIVALKVTGAIIGVIAAFIAILFGIAGLSKVNEKVAKSNSLFVQKYRAQKSKICPTVEFE